MAGNVDSDAIEQKYMHSILGQLNPLAIDDSIEDDASDLLRLLRVDSLFNLGQTDLAKELLNNVTLGEDEVLSTDKDGEEAQGTRNDRHAFFRDGLQALLRDFKTVAYNHFVQASKRASGLEAVFYKERAVNIAFWIVCSGKMLEAAKDLDVKHMPYAGGVLSFAKYMNGDIDQAEQVARQAMEDGFQDPWTIHSIAHCLYSQGKALECTKFLDEYRPLVQQSQPSAFMKGHLEFHQALCYIDLEDTAALIDGLINGPLWTGLTEAERQDYWNAAGLLNVQWKAELRGMSPQPIHPESIKEAMAILMPTASVSKSMVFSLCILRWSTGAFRAKWKEQLLILSGNYNNAVLAQLTRAIDAVYPSALMDQDSSAEREYAKFSSQACSRIVETYLAPYVDKLYKLGASPEQREVLEEFLVVAAKAAGKDKLPIGTINMKGWTQRNYRPNTKFYSSVLGL